MFGIGLPEMIVIAIVALVFIGPNKLPGVLRSIGKGLVELKRATSDVRSTVQDEMQKIEEEIELSEIRKTAEDFGNELGGVANKMEPLSISKKTTEDHLHNFLDSTDQSELVTSKESITKKSNNSKSKHES